MYNKVILIGRLTVEPELRTTAQGTNMCSFSIAVDRGFKTKEGEKQTDFINITSWRNQAEFICKFFTKGKLIGIEGSLQSRNYTDKEGNKRTAFDVVCEKAFFTESKGAAGGASGGQAFGTTANNYHPEPTSGVSFENGAIGDFEVVSDEDLPF